MGKQLIETNAVSNFPSDLYEGRSKSFASRYVRLKNFSIFIHQ